MSGQNTVLLVHNDAEVRETLATMLRRRGYKINSATDGLEAEARLGAGVPDLMIVEMLLPGRSGFHLTRLVKEATDGKAAVIMLGETVAEAHRDYALALGVDRLLVRPFTTGELLDAVVSHGPPPRLMAGSRPITSTQAARI